LDESLNRQIQTNGELRQENAHLNEVINELRQGMNILNNEKDEYLQEIEKGKSIRLGEMEKDQDNDQLTEKVNDLKEDLHKQVTANTMIEEENTKLVTRIDELLKNTDALEVEKSSCISECQNLENELNILKEKKHDYEGMAIKICELEDKLAQNTLANDHKLVDEDNGTPCKYLDMEKSLNDQIQTNNHVAFLLIYLIHFPNFGILKCETIFLPLMHLCSSVARRFG
jgi:uncharacterized metal-binding protein